MEVVGHEVLARVSNHRGVSVKVLPPQATKFLTIARFPSLQTDPDSWGQL